LLFVVNTSLTYPDHYNISLASAYSDSLGNSDILWWLKQSYEYGLYCPRMIYECWAEVNMVDTLSNLSSKWWCQPLPSAFSYIPNLNNILQYMLLVNTEMCG